MKRLFILLGVLLVCVLILAGCSSSPATTAPVTSPPPKTTAPVATSAPVSTAQPPASTTAALQPKKGGNLRVITAIDPGNWGWPPTAAGTTPGVQNYCYENLIDMDFQGNISPKLASK